LLMLSWRRGLVWKRSWTALVLASTICFYVADFVVPQLYLPDRYTRYSIAVLLVLWHGCNWSHVLAALKRPWAYQAGVVAVTIFAMLGLPETFRPSDGDKELGRWEERSEVQAMSRVIAELPDRVLVAGHPYYLGDVMVQARRPVLVIHRMFHAWYVDYREVMDQRIRDTFKALYARNPEDVDRLAERYGATHLVVPKSIYELRWRESGAVYRAEYSDFIARLASGPSDFVLFPPPVRRVVFEDRRFWLVQLPLDKPGPSGDVPAGEVSGATGEGER